MIHIPYTPPPVLVRVSDNEVLNSTAVAHAERDADTGAVTVRLLLPPPGVNGPGSTELTYTGKEAEQVWNGLLVRSS